MKRSVSLASGLIFMVLSGAATAETGEHTAHEAPTPKEAPNTLTLSQERLQSIGVKFEEAARRPVEKLIRTVGRVEMDERRMARVNLKIEGWIDRLLVNTTGEKVKKGQVLFTLYSPELLATQEEYLLAVRAAQTLGGSEFPEVAEGAKTILDVSRRRLQLWDVADSHIQELERTGKVLKALPFHAPLSGTVIEKTAMAGMRVMPGEVLYTIADLSQVWVLADIYEYELPLVEPGQTATVSLSYAPQATFSGRIGFIYPTVDPETRTAKVRFELENPKELLKPGMYADVQLAVPLGERLAVPRDAVLESGERQVIFIHHGGGKLEWRSVKTGQRSGDWVEILEGLKEGEHIVTSANFLLDSESQLKAAVGGMAGMKH
ncbi:MAG TPA: efflux RND transporter periplasmic adaptor subunit [Methylococcaceae bacterium]|nr:efflux RND transporter periplasmic adaptor subunit [Methylococcaceae bacterium]